MRLINVQKRNSQVRQAFTLVELLVVITILFILMALTLGVISKVYAYLDETKVVSEINKLATACEQFKATFGRYPPSRVVICEGANQLNLVIAGSVAPPASSGLTTPQYQALGSFTAEYLAAIFPGIDLSAGRDWNGDGLINQAPVILDGDQCLVYFLGGLRYGSTAGGFSAPSGFNTDKTNPTYGTTGARLGPFFEFDAARLSNSANLNFPNYKDIYGTPYAYFASKFQGMNNYPNAYLPVTNQQANDCHALTTNGTVYFVPYFSSAVPPGTVAGWATATAFKFHKPETYQIISAGKDKLFGTGGQYNQVDPEQSLFMPTAMVPAATQALLQANYDNITNVTGGRVVPK